MQDDDDYSYFVNKKPDKTYVSKRLRSRADERPMRIASKVIDAELDVGDIQKIGEQVLRVTPGQREEIVASFYEDDRSLQILKLQRYFKLSGMPFKSHFAFTGSEIDTLLEFVANLRRIPLTSAQRINLTDEQLRKLILSHDQARRLVLDNEALFAQMAQNEVTGRDVVALGYRRLQLHRFSQLLDDQEFFQSEEQRLGLSGEALWQNFFEGNKWIFGYGLTSVFLSALDERKLERVVRGADISGRGKRADAVLRTRGLISSLCFVEIKRHDTELLIDRSYRSDIWRPSDELSGGVSQAQGTMYAALRRIGERLPIVKEDGSPTDEVLYGISPKSFLIIGRLSEFLVNSRTHEGKFRSFELYRRNLSAPEIITFDELYYRAKLILETDAPAP